jgi:hypothetical protein
MENTVTHKRLWQAGLKCLKDNIEEVERMLKALIQSLENKHLDPWTLGPSSPTKLEKNQNYTV